MDEYIAFTIHHGSITLEIFDQFVAEQVLPQCTPYVDGGPRSIIILDNTKIHVAKVGGLMWSSRSTVNSTSYFLTPVTTTL